MERMSARVRLALGLLAIGGLGCDAHASPGSEVELRAAAAIEEPHDDASDRKDQDDPGDASVHEDAPVHDDTPELDDGPEPALQLRRPPARALREAAPYFTIPPKPGHRTALAWQFDAPVFRYPAASRRPLGLARRNTRLAVARYLDGSGCPRRWAELLEGGYVCPGDGFTVSTDPPALDHALQVGPPAVDEALPYRYAKLTTPAPLYWRMPTAAELASGSKAPIREWARGAHFVAMDERVRVGEEAMSRTVRGFYVRDRDVEATPAATMEGELLLGDDALPLAFVHAAEGVELVDPETGAPLGVAERFARFTVKAEREHEGRRLVLATDGFAAAAEHVRVVRRQPRPDEVGADEQWIHVDLAQQTLVAYQGDEPVLATLVSSGKAGFEPPLGLFRVHKKYTTVTMSGPDPDAGSYAVEEVPWTMYYWGSFALHGAYWHDEFGHERSHGCTNLPPADAHWLYHWGAPALPEGWHAMLGIRGPWIYFTR